jgi:uncharacterized protein YeaO (DUF488 family)
MELFTSNYSRHGVFPTSVAVSRKPPDGYKGRWFVELAPSWALINALKTHEINKDQYTEWYYESVLCGLDAHEVVEKLGDGAIMLCFESPTDFCHRHLIAEWITEETGIIVREKALIKEPSLVDDLFTF